MRRCSKQLSFVARTIFMVTTYSLCLDVHAEKSSDAWDSVEANSVEEKPSLLSQIPLVYDAPNEYFYASFGKPDPFQMPAIVNQSRTTMGPTIEIPLVSPLQTALANLVVRGIWEVNGEGQRKALITVQQAGENL